MLCHIVQPLDMQGSIQQINFHQFIVISLSNNFYTLTANLSVTLYTCIKLTELKYLHNGLTEWTAVHAYLCKNQSCSHTN